ncbi:signal peptidase I [Pustulibacterium marinum]|uniref:Signal peptidase I n=1 Tax=Pustulibacterium marinum TaxID=1224947 RepID=A0A1I7H5U2_9FLAO|nr:signal peptidase I [Pustulibacterium marinum]SFU56067.1 signal peptidase I [Pustulibacterium marinum]
MTLYQWFVFFLLVQVVHFLATWKLYVKAGRKSWEAAVPVYNAVILMKIINRPWWWVLLLFIPVINVIMIPVIWVETIRSFGRNTTADTFLVLFTLGFYIFYVNYGLDVTYIEDRSLKPRTVAGEWANSIIFAVIAATFVHTYIMQPFVIPTPSLEKTLLVGDFLFVSKFHYGARLPMTAVAAPMVHDTIPVVGVKSYLKEPQYPYFRLPGLQKIERNEIVVFNWPVDTVRYFGDRSNIHVDKPLDKKSNYVKRCVGIPGDELEIKDGFIYINGERTKLGERAKPQYSYSVYTRYNLSPEIMYSRFGVTNGFGGSRKLADGSFQYQFASLTDEMVSELQKNSAIDSIVKMIIPKGIADPSVFPHSSNMKWNRDNFGPISIPEKGEKVELSLENLPLYERIISDYEGHDLQVKGSQILVDGKPTNSYTFGQDYYWMMGDNRHNSEDSRFWGYVPFDHVLGKPVFVWFSWDSFAKKPRWDRIFTTVDGGGNSKPTSYFMYFVILLVGYFVFDFFRKKNKKKKLNY